MKHPVLIKKHYTIYFEYVDQLIIYHCDVHKWNKSVRSKYISDIKQLFRLQERPVFAFCHKDNTKLIKFAFLSGFVPFAESVQVASGDVLDMFIWSEVNG